MKNKFRMRRKIKITRKKVDVFFLFDNDTNDSIPVTIEDKDIPFSEELEFFFNDKVRKVWHRQEEEGYFSVVDVCQILMDGSDGRKYWNKLKQRLREEGFEPVSKCHQFKMLVLDGKMRKTDCASTENLLRIIQSIPSPKAEPFKQWLAVAGNARKDLEARLGRSVISKLNATSPNLLSNTTNE